MADVVTHHDQNDREEERNAPAPLHEGFPWSNGCHDCQHCGSQKSPDRYASLWARAEETAAVHWATFDGHQDRASPFATCRNALEDAKEDQQHRRDNAYLAEGWQNANKRGGHAHHDERDHENLAAADLVAIVSGEERAERAEQEAQTHRHEGDDD